MKLKVFVGRAIVATLVVMTVAANRASAQSATPQDQCMAQLGNCYYWAALQNGFWSMWSSGIDCEFQFIECIRRSIIGA